jgi:predicted phage tail protein
LSFENRTFETSDVPLNFTVNQVASKIAYCLDGQENLTISGNTTLTGLPNGEHNITVYATDETGNTGASETIIFNVAKPEPPSPFPTTLVATASGASVAVVGLGLLVYFKKRKR